MKHTADVSAASLPAGSRPTFAEWLRALEAQGLDVPRLAPHHLELLRVLESLASSAPPRRLIICAPPSRLPLRRQD